MIQIMLRGRYYEQAKNLAQVRDVPRIRLRRVQAVRYCYAASGSKWFRSGSGDVVIRSAMIDGSTQCSGRRKE